MFDLTKIIPTSNPIQRPVIHRTRKDLYEPPTHLEVLGATFPVKAELQALGATWSWSRRVWLIPADRFWKATQIVKDGKAGCELNALADFDWSTWARTGQADLVKAPGA